MSRRNFIIGFLVFDIVAVLVIVLILLINNPFKATVAPNTDPTTTTTVEQNYTGTLSHLSDLDQSKDTLLHQTPVLTGVREESTLTEDGRYYTAFRAEADLDLDGDGEIETVSISLDDHSESFYVLVNQGGKITDYVVPGNEFAYRSEYSAKACKGSLRGFAVDLNKNDKYTEVGIEMIRDTWEEYQTLMVRYDGNAIYASVVPGVLTALDDAGAVQFSSYDMIYGVHKLYRSYDITNKTDFLSPQTEYSFTDMNVEKTSYLYTPDKDVKCENLNGDAVVLKVSSQFYWSRTDGETFVDVVTTNGEVYRFPIKKEIVEYSTGPQAVYTLGDTNARDIKVK